MITHHDADEKLLENITSTIVARLNPYRILLFGSRARGDAHEDSDYDFLIEMDSELRGPYRAMQVGHLFPHRDWSMDVFVYTPDEIRRKRDDVGTVVYTAVREGRVLYERE